MKYYAIKRICLVVKLKGYKLVVICDLINNLERFGITRAFTSRCVYNCFQEGLTENGKTTLDVDGTILTSHRGTLSPWENNVTKHFTLLLWLPHCNKINLPMTVQINLFSLKLPLLGIVSHKQEQLQVHWHLPMNQKGKGV